MHERVRPGDWLWVEGPRNHFPVPEAHPLVFVAGGIGITPILSMVCEAADQGRQFVVHYGARTRTAMYAVDRLLEAAGSQRVTLWPQDETGLLDVDRLIGPGSAVVGCGPPQLLEALHRRCAHLSVPLSVERFVGTGEVRPASPAALERYQVFLARSEVTVEVTPGRSLLDAITAAGIVVPTSCREGVCGSCRTKVIAGTPDHRDHILGPGERAGGKVMMVCCGGSCSDRLELDL